MPPAGGLLRLPAGGGHARGSVSLASAAVGRAPGSATVNAVSYYQKVSGWKGPATAALTGAVLAAVGDLMAQYLGAQQQDVQCHSLEHQEQEQMQQVAGSDAIDSDRTLIMAGFGTWWAATQWYWFMWIEHVCPSKTMINIAKKVSANQLVLAPIGCASVFAWTLTMNGRAHEIPNKLATDFFPTLVSCWMFWVPAATINFKWVPLAKQVVFMNTVGLVWNCYLSSAAAGNKITPANSAVTVDASTHAEHHTHMQALPQQQAAMA